MPSTILGARRRRRIRIAVVLFATAAAAGALAWYLQRPVAVQPVTAQTGWDEADTWAFEPPPDDFSADALLDLRSLNEAVAGQSGFVRTDGQGELLRGDGQPIRFWAVSSDVAREPHAARPLWTEGAPDLARHARFLAKRGVNLVRLHRQISPNLDRQPKAAITDIDEQERDAIWRAVAAYRKEGIYIAISPYWAVPMKFAPAWGVLGGAEQPALGLLFFDDKLQAAYKAWLKKLLAEPNPHTGLPLARDPSVALVQIQNEDSLLFWTLNGIQGPQRGALETRFGRYAAARHGSVYGALRAWGGSPVDGDTPEAGRLSLLHIWDMTQPTASPERARRLADQTEFLARAMHDFNAAITRYLKDELGVGSLVNAGNWRTASASRLGDAERWSYTAADVDAVNHYTGGIHQGEHANWAIVPGDRYVSDSVLRAPTGLPVAIKQTAGRPMLLTEGAWVPPNVHGAEGPLLVAAYGSLIGLDGYCWFATAEEGWGRPRSANGYFASLAKWTIAAPETLGGFPAAALAFRLGYVRRGEVALHEQRTLDALWRREPARIAEEPGFDPNRDRGDAAARELAAGSVPPEAFLIGPVQVAFGGAPTAVTASAGASARGLVEPGRVRANTGEIELDSAQGWARIDAPSVQAVAAHFGAAPEHRLRDVTFTSGNAFGAAWAVSLDGAPLATSKRILLQYTTQSRPTGWQDRPATLELQEHGQPPRRVAGREIVAIGTAPWRVVNGRLTVEVRNPRLTKATVVDANGNAGRELGLEKVAGGVRVVWPGEGLYVVLQ